MFTFRFRFLEQGIHTHIRLFAGKTGGTLAKCGDFVMRNNEWETFKESFAADALVEFVDEEAEHSSLIPR